MSPNIRKLADRMRRRSRTIAFVGAGASASVGYPTWGELIEGLYRRAKATHALSRPQGDQDLRWIAERYAQDLDESLMDEVRHVFEEAGPEGPGPIHRMLARLPFDHYITTNYDRLIEQACDQELADARGWRTEGPGLPKQIVEPCLPRSGPDQEQFSGFLSMMAEDSRRRGVLHLHGTLGDRLTLTMADYNRQYLTDATLLRMFAIFATSTVVFIGASLRDPDVMELVRRAHHHSGPRPRHFAFLSDDRMDEEVLLERNYGIQPIFYHVDEHGGHFDLVHRLEQLLELVEERPDYSSPLRPQGNVQSPMLLSADEGPEFDNVVDQVKNEVRRQRTGLATFSGVDELTSSRVLRRIATDYSWLPASHHFRNVVWLSPATLGRFPGEAGARSLADAFVGEMTSALGAHRLTAVRDNEHNFRAIGRLLQGGDDLGPESTLIVIDAVEELIQACDAEEAQLFRGLFQNLPRGSVAVLSHREDTDPFDDQGEWAGIKSHVELDSISGVAISGKARQTWGTGSPLVDDELALKVLLATCIFASPVNSGTLASILDLPPGDVERAVADLAESGRLEVERLPVESRVASLATAGERIPDGGMGDVTTSSPVRVAVLRASSELIDASQGHGQDVLTDVVRRMLSWSRSFIASLNRWEADKDLFLEVVGQVSDLLAAFEAGCWLDGVRARLGLPQDDRFIDTWLWLGADLAHILPYTGRWGEAYRIVQHLNKHIDRAQEPEAFGRELKIQESRIVGVLAADEAEIQEAEVLANSAIESAQVELSGGDGTPSHDRTALELHVARGRIRLGQVLLRQERYDEAREQFELVYHNAFQGPDEQPGGRLLKYAADAAGWLGEVMSQSLSEQPTTEEVTEVLRVLDHGFSALVHLGNKRDRGLQAVLRGHILDMHGNVASARRNHARALMVSHEFSDRYLEAQALYGLARADGSRALASRSASIFSDFSEEVERSAQDLFYELPPVEPENVTGRTSWPSFIVFLGPHGTGKTTAMRTAKLALTSWGFKPQVEEFTPQLLERWRTRDDLGLEEVHERLRERLDQRNGATGAVVLATVPVVHPGELFAAWPEDDPLLSDSLCIQLKAPADVLESRNRERHGEGVDYARLADSADHLSKETPPAPHVTWASWVEIRGGCYVELPSDIPIRDFQASVREALALSYVEVESIIYGDW